MYKISPVKLLTLVIIVISALGTSAQSLEVVPSKTVYTRKGKDIPDYKKTFEVIVPIIKSGASPSVIKKIQSELDYWRLFDITLEESLADYTWLEIFDFNVNYNKNNLLDISLFAEGSAAYPDTAVKDFLIDIRSGKHLGFDDLFSKNQQASLLKKIQIKMSEAEKEEIKETPETKEILEDYRQSDALRIPEPENLKLSDLKGISVSDEGITFKYDYNFSRVIRALQPTGTFLFTFKEIKPYILPGSLLETIAR